jgi:hypothetical protein
MVRTPRHSKPKTEAVTIDLDKDDVSTIDDQVEDQATDVADESVEAKDTETTADNTDGSDQEQASSDEASETKADENKKSTGSVFTANGPAYCQAQILDNLRSAHLCLKELPH